MKYWMYVTPAGDSSLPIWTIYSEAAIIAEYWDEWYRNAISYNLDNDRDRLADITQENCIEDWIVINWAMPATADTLAEILSAPKG